MKRHRKTGYLIAGTEVITDELRVATVDWHYNDSKVVIRYHSPPWPFPEIDVKTRCQLTEVALQLEDAPF